MVWIALYAAVALVCAAAAFLFAEWRREPGTPAPDNPVVPAVAAGVLWPLMILGLAQLALIAAAQSRVRPAIEPRVLIEEGLPA